jgi:hypothetical protein
MSANNISQAILIRENSHLPADLAIETEVFLPGWRIVKNLDRSALTRKIEGGNWNFFYLAGEIRATVLGRDQAGTLRRAVKRVLAKREGQKFNSLEITKVDSKRFLGIPFMSVTAHYRHIQQGIGLVAAKDFALRMPVAAPTKEAATKQYVALISST